MKISIDCSELEEANNEHTATTYYGGRIRIFGGGKEVYVNGVGSDRDSELYFAVKEAVEKVLGREMTEEERDEFEENDELCNFIDCAFEFPGCIQVPVEDSGLDTIVLTVTVRHEDAVKVIDALHGGLQKAPVGWTLADTNRRVATLGEAEKFERMKKEADAGS